MIKLQKNKILIMLAIFFVAIFGLLFISETSNKVYAEATDAVVTNSGVCGPTATWELTSDGTLHISGEGSMTEYSYGSAPWYGYAYNITSIIVDDPIISISNGAFNGCNNLKEISLPFVGESRDAIGYKATFGYIFGYDNYRISVSTTYNNWEGIYYTTADVTSTLEGQIQSHTIRSSQNDYKAAAEFIYNDKGEQKYVDYYQKVNSDKYVPYQISGSLNTLSIPRETTWQYSCYNYTYNNNYNLSSYYYFIPSSLTKVTITDANNISSAAFNGCENITELNLNNEITEIGDYAFQNLGMIKHSTDDYVTSGNILLAYNGASDNAIIPNGIRLIAPRAFYAKKTLATIKFADTITWVGDYAFYNCTNAIISIPKVSGSLEILTDGFTNAGSVEYIDQSYYTNGNDTFYYTIDENGNAIIVGCNTTSANITLPTTLGGVNVTTVGYKGMANCTSLKSVTIPKNITKLDLYAFVGCTGLDTITIPATCVYIGEYAFSGCTSLTTVVIAEGVTYVGDNSFENCTSLTEIVVPDSCTYLGNYVFYNCISLQSATIGINVPNIGDYAFYNCENLATVVIGIAVENIGDYAFFNTALSRVTAYNNLKTIGNYAFASCNNLTRVSLKSGIENIGVGAFKDDILLDTINLPSSINNIGEYAFYNCSVLTNITIPQLVTSINDYTFAYCSQLANVTINGVLQYIGNYAFYRCSLSKFDFKEGLEEIGVCAFEYNHLTALVLPSSLCFIGEKAFNNNIELTNVSMPDSVSDVGAYALVNNAENLTITIRYNTGKIADRMLYNTPAKTIIIEEGITEIGDYVFALNRNLTTIIMPETLQIIGNYAFYDNRSYAELTLPKNVVKIGDYAFARGYILKKLSLPDSVESIGASAFYRDEDKEIFPDVTIEIYYNKGVICDDLLNGQGIHRIFVNDNIYSIGNSVFANCQNLLTVSLPDTISNFGTNCFFGDYNIQLTIRTIDGLIDDEVYREKLQNVVMLQLDNSNIGNYAFMGNPELQNVFIFASSSNYSIRKIGSHAFDSCKSIGAIILPETVNYIGEYAFYDCNSMTAINIPNGVNKVLSHTFYGCASLNNILVPNSVVAVEDYAFYGCVKATSIILSNQCKSIGECAFYNCKGLLALDIPDSVASIGDYAFRSCVEITELTFSDNIEEIGVCAFYDCNALKTVRLGKRIIELKDRMFYGCVNLESLYIKAPLSYIDELAFYGAEDVTVYCGRDEYMINFFNENGINYVIDESQVYEYKVVFKNDDGTILSSEIYPYGTNVVIPTAPTKGADLTYTYTFKGWDKQVTSATKNAEYGAVYEATYIEYTIIFKNWNGEIVLQTTYHYGDKIIAPTPTKDADLTYTYEFIGWDSDVVDCEGNAEYVAKYNSVFIEYNIVFKDWDNSIISEKNYHYGDNIELPSNPTRNADMTYTYEFANWNNQVVDCAGNAEYIAQYTPTYIDYTVVFKNWNNNVLSTTTYHYGDNIVEPTAPSKDADLTYTYSFAGWDNVVATCVGNTEYIAQFTPVYIEYSIVFKNWNNEILSNKTYHYGDSINEPTTPTKQADLTYTYTFNGWDKDVVNCAGNAEYVAQYTPVYIEYKIVFKNWNNDVLSSKAYHYNDEIVVPSNPTRDADNTYIYKFSGWDKQVINCAGDAEYIAQYTSTYIDYVVIFKNYNGNVLSTTKYHYGDSVAEPAAPIKQADNTYTYTFNGWDKDVVDCAGNVEYIAQFKSVYIEYDIIFKNYDGSILSGTTYHYGDSINEPTTPTKKADLTYTYKFKGWDKNIVNCASNIIYTAQYTPTYIEYNIVFKNWDNSIIKSVNYHYGDKVVNISAPQRKDDETYIYTFAGWDKELGVCTGNVDFIAQYNKTYKEYNVVFKNYDGKVLSESIYHFGDKIITPANPNKKSDLTYNYVFSKWINFSSTCQGDTEYIAEFDNVYIEYAIAFKNWNGDILSNKTYHYGDNVTAPTNPIRSADMTYTYKFSGWDKQVVPCKSDMTYNAQYSKSFIDYKVTFKNDNGSIISSKTYHYGDKIIAPKNPVKSADKKYTYAFVGWDKEIANCLGNTEFIAQYASEFINYTITFKDYDGKILSTKKYHYGDVVDAPNNPIRNSDETNKYEFIGWNKEVVACSDNAEYIATYKTIELKKEGLSAGAAAGIATGGTALLSGVGILVFWLIRKKKKIV